MSNSLFVITNSFPVYILNAHTYCPFLFTLTFLTFNTNIYNKMNSKTECCLQNFSCFIKFNSLAHRLGLIFLFIAQTSYTGDCKSILPRFCMSTNILKISRSEVTQNEIILYQKVIIEKSAIQYVCSVLVLRKILLLRTGVLHQL